MVVDSINAATVVSGTKRVAQYLVDTTLSRAKKSNVGALFTITVSVLKPLVDNGLSNLALINMSFSLSFFGL